MKKQASEMNECHISTSSGLERRRRRGRYTNKHPVGLLGVRHEDWTLIRPCGKATGKTGGQIKSGGEKRGRNNSDVANPDKKSENDGGGEIRKKLFIVKIRSWGLT